MVNVRLEQKPAFKVTGVKTWISKVEDFHDFWEQCHQNGTVSKLKSLNNASGEITKSHIFGVSRVENDPDNRDFYFYIAAESGGCHEEKFETFTVGQSLWAIFKCSGEVTKALFEAEMYAFKEWLPSSKYKHAFAPELEVYPSDDNNSIEFWLPIVEKQAR